MKRTTKSTPVSWVTHDVAVTDPQPHLLREWLITNGAGGFASGTLTGAHARRYHALFVAAAHPPVGRVVALNQVLEQLVLAKGQQRQVLEFTTLAFRGGEGQRVLAPRGVELLRQFKRSLGVTWVYRWGDLELQRELNLHWKTQAATVAWRVTGLDRFTHTTATLRLAPMLTLRDFHALLRRDHAGPWDVAIAGVRDTVLVTRAATSVTLHVPGANFRGQSDEWWHDVWYAIDEERGQDCREDYFLPGWFEAALPAQRETSLSMTVTLGQAPADPLTGEDPKRSAHLQPLLRQLREFTDEPTAKLLAIAGDDFIVDRTLKGKKLATVIAGYPWFSDWGRDTFIAMEGLLLDTARFDEALSVFRAFAAAIRNGLVPNRFDDYEDSAAHYNTVDGSLWFIHAALRYVELSNDRKSWDELLAPAVKTILEAYIKGTDYDIRMTGDGLISAGNAGTQLTWMDAATGGVVFTPRHGKAVEINALWYSALVGAARLLRTSDRPAATHYDKLAARIKRSFPKVFAGVGEGLIDHVWTDAQGNDHPDLSIRPNQIFVASLPDSPLPRTAQTKMLKLVRERLLTPFGLLTLPPGDPNYHARFTGTQFDRDKAYHQGTIWPWLIGPYAEAVLRVGKFSPASKREALAAITPLLEMMAGKGDHAALGQIYEVHEAAFPHRPAGCNAQAWSVAALVHVLALLNTQP